MDETQSCQVALDLFVSSIHYCIVRCPRGPNSPPGLCERPQEVAPNAQNRAEIDGYSLLACACAALAMLKQRLGCHCFFRGPVWGTLSLSRIRAARTGPTGSCPILAQRMAPKATKQTMRPCLLNALSCAPRQETPNSLLLTAMCSIYNLRQTLCTTRSSGGWLGCRE